MFNFTDRFDDGAGGIFGEAWGPPPGSRAGEIDLDDEETWVATDPVPAGSISLVAGAAHEIGHALGLRHPDDVRGSIMNARIPPDQQSLAQDDIDGIRELYGVRDGAQRTFEARGFSQPVSPVNAELAKRLAIDDARRTAEAAALDWVRNVSCPRISPVKNSSIETIDEEATPGPVQRSGNAKFIEATARLRIRATLLCRTLARIIRE